MNKVDKDTIYHLCDEIEAVNKIVAKPISIRRLKDDPLNRWFFVVSEDKYETEDLNCMWAISQINHCPYCGETLGEVSDTDVVNNDFINTCADVIREQFSK